MEERQYGRQVFKGGLERSVMGAKEGSSSSSSASGGGKDAGWVAPSRIMSRDELKQLFTLGRTESSETAERLAQLSAPPPVRSPAVAAHIAELLGTGTTPSSSSDVSTLLPAPLSSFIASLSHHDHLLALRVVDKDAQEADEAATLAASLAAAVAANAASGNGGVASPAGGKRGGGSKTVSAVGGSATVFAGIPAMVIPRKKPYSSTTSPISVTSVSAPSPASSLVHLTSPTSDIVDLTGGASSNSNRVGVPLTGSEGPVVIPTTPVVDLRGPSPPVGTASASAGAAAGGQSFDLTHDDGDASTSSNTNRSSRVAPMQDLSLDYSALIGPGASAYSASAAGGVVELDQTGNVGDEGGSSDEADKASDIEGEFGAGHGGMDLDEVDRHMGRMSLSPTLAAAAATSVGRASMATASHRRSIVPTQITEAGEDQDQQQGDELEGQYDAIEEADEGGGQDLDATAIVDNDDVTGGDDVGDGFGSLSPIGAPADGRRSYGHRPSLASTAGDNGYAGSPAPRRKKGLSIAPGEAAAIAALNFGQDDGEGAGAGAGADDDDGEGGFLRPDAADDGEEGTADDGEGEGTITDPVAAAEFEQAMDYLDEHGSGGPLSEQMRVQALRTAAVLGIEHMVNL